MKIELLSVICTTCLVTYIDSCDLIYVGLQFNWSVIAFARRKLWVQAPSIATRLMIGLWVRCSRSHLLFIMFFFLLFFLFYVTSLNCILNLLDNVFGLFKIFFYLFIYFPFFFLIDWLDFLYLTLYLGLSYENHVCGSLWLRNH